MIGVMIFLIVFSILCTAFIAPSAQYNNYEINPQYFKKIKLRNKAQSFFFKGIGGKDCTYGDTIKYGVIYPMFVIQVLGYILSICSLILTFVLIFAFKTSIVTVAVVNCLMLLFQGIAYVITTLACIAVTRSKNKEK